MTSTRDAELLIARDDEETARGTFHRVSDLTCPNCGVVRETPPPPPEPGVRFSTMTCIDPDCAAEYDAVPFRDGSWIVRLRGAWVWRDFSDGPDWLEKGGLGDPAVS